MLYIKRLEDAHAVWQKFNLKYKDLSPGISPDKQALYVRQDVSKEFIDAVEKNQNSYTQAARKLQGFWIKRRQSNILVQVNAEGNHSSDFIHLLNYNKQNSGVKKSINKIKLDRLLKAIDQGDWADPIFNSVTLPRLALSLYASEKISQQQIYTILERYQTLKDYELVSDFEILNPDGTFSLAAKELLLPLLNQRHYLSGLSPQQLEEFRLMVAALPQSEQLFYVTNKGKLQEKRNYDQLGHTLIGLDGMLAKGKVLFHLSAGVRDALGLVKFGLKEYVRPMPRLGQQMLADIEHGVAHRARYAALNYPGTKPYEKVHEYKEVNDLEATSHDVYHSNVLSTIPENFIKVLERFVAVSRENTPFKWSKEIWDWVDSDYIFFFHRLGYTPKTDDMDSSTELLCEMLEYGNGTSNELISMGGSLLRHDEPTLLGCLIFIDMIKNRQQWLDLNINPDKLTGSFKFYYSLVDYIYDGYLKGEDISIQTLKLQSYFVLVHHNYHQHSYQAVIEIIDAEKATLVNTISFNKKKNDKNDVFSNTIFLGLNGKQFNEVGLCELIKSHYRNTHASTLPDLEEHYVKGILELGYTRSQASRYTGLIQQGKTDSNAQFFINPTFGNWVVDNKVKIIMSLILVVPVIFVLLYGVYQTQEARTDIHQNDKMALEVDSPVVNLSKGGQAEEIDDADNQPLAEKILGQWREHPTATDSHVRLSRFSPAQDIRVQPQAANSITPSRGIPFAKV